MYGNSHLKAAAAAHLWQVGDAERGIPVLPCAGHDLLRLQPAQIPQVAPPPAQVQAPQARMEPYHWNTSKVSNAGTSGALDLQSLWHSAIVRCSETHA